MGHPGTATCLRLRRATSLRSATCTQEPPSAGVVGRAGWVTVGSGCSREDERRARDAESAPWPSASRGYASGQRLGVADGLVGRDVGVVERAGVRVAHL